MYSTNNSHSGMNGISYAQTQKTFISKVFFTGFILILMTFSGFQVNAQTTVVVEDIILRVANPAKQDVNLTVYPNPATDRVVAKVDGAEQIQSVKIYDLSGRHIQSYTPGFAVDTYKVNISNIPSGTYIMRIKTEKGLASRKFTVAQS